MNDSMTTLFLASLLVLFAAGTPVYDPTDDITVNCGYSGNSTRLGDSRSWIGDVDNLKYAPRSADGNDSKIISGAPLRGSSMVPDAVPYNSARLSTSPFTYTIHLTPGPKFVRLYFYSSDYGGQNFSRSNAVFSVEAGSYALLKDFSPSLVADNLYDSVGFSPNEFIVCVGKNQVLNLTFLPSASVPGSYAFVNGIEVVSMPDELYYTKTDASSGIALMGQTTTYVIDNYDALETVKRVNVGGKAISPGDDTGMYRSWEQDQKYLVEKNDLTGYGVTPENSSIQLTYSSQTPNYTAPEEVYKTARSMGDDSSANLRSNLTWSFQVDSKFHYLVRLHFCEFLSNITQPTDRVFRIFIDSKTAESRFDIMSSSGKGVPMYRDYAVAMLDGQRKWMNLSIALHPLGNGVTKYSDAILNGIEIFKINNTGGSLAGPNPDPTIQGTLPLTPRTMSGSNRRRTIAGIIAGGIPCFVIIFLLVLFIHRRRKVGKGSSASTSDGVTSLWGPLSYDGTTKSSANTWGSPLPANLCRHFLLAEIKAATNNFDEIFIVGVGGFGNVYKGYIDSGLTQVAIKRLNPGSQQGAHEFMTEIEMLSQLRHLHLVSLIGYCNDSGEMILVYDYMARGTLREHLYETDNPPLSWKRRLEICIGAARGLQYLHTGAKQAVIHRDMKTTNILLDEKWVAKVSDFGLSKFGPTGMSKAHVSTVVKGTFGYLDPEYYRRQQLTDKSDVYSFGVVLFEVLCARLPMNRSMEKKQINLASWVQICYKSGNIQRIVDPKVKGEIVPECLKKFCEIAISCLNDEGTKRPSMNDVVWSLEFALQLQESIEKEGGYPGKPDGLVDDEAEPPITMTSSDDMISSSDTKSIKMTNCISAEFNSSTNSYDSENLLSRAVFSELLGPKGR